MDCDYILVLSVCVACMIPKSRVAPRAFWPVSKRPFYQTIRNLSSTQMQITKRRA